MNNNRSLKGQMMIWTVVAIGIQIALFVGGVWFALWALQQFDVI